MTSFALKFVLIWGWRRVLTAACFGILSAAALPPLSLWPVLFISMPVLVWLLDGVHAQSEARRRLWPAFCTGWSFAFGYFLVSLHWIGEAFLVEADVFAWALPFAVTLLPAGLAVFWGLAAMLAIWFWRPGLVRIVGLAASLALFEWLRGTVLSGFPWNTPGYVVDALQPLAQLGSLVGIFGVTLLVVLWSATPAALTDDTENHRRLFPRIVGMLLIFCSLAASFVYGSWRLGQPSPGFQEGINLRIVQPNISQAEKWNPNRREEIFARYLKLTLGDASNAERGAISHVIWPESALPVLIAELGELRKQIGGLLGGKAVYIMGAVTRHPGPEGRSNSKVHNSVIAVSGSGEVVAQYHKQRLVPFGEFLPFADLLEPLGLRKIVTLPLGFSPGSGPLTLIAPDTPPFAALVCYETIFPTGMVDAEHRPQWLINVTNDAWFGHSIGPHQHFAQARMRAIEQGLPMIRAANTGISAIIDPRGRVLSKLDLDQAGIIDGRLPKPLTPTIYAKYGNLLFFLLLGLAFLTVYGHFSQGRKFRTSHTTRSSANTRSSTR